MRQIDRQWHKASRLIASKAEHDTLVTSTGVLAINAGLDLERLNGDVLNERQVSWFKAPAPIDMADIGKNRLGDLAKVQLGGRGDLAEKAERPAFDSGLDGDARAMILL